MGIIQTPMASIVPYEVNEEITRNVGKLILRAALFGDYFSLCVYIKAGGDPDYICPVTGLTPLMAAAQNGYFEIVKDLIEMAHVFPCPYAACAAQKRGHKRIAEFLWNYESPLVPQSSYYCVTGELPD
jgi:ankyrin repeat protein